MLIEKIPLKDMNPASYNPRLDLKPGDPDYESLSQSIDVFGFVEPLVWNKQTGNLVSGHQRLKILKQKGIKEIEVSVVDLSLEKEKALNLALNRIKGDWDEDKLGELLNELRSIPDLDLSLSGFNPPEISKIIDDYLEPGNEDDFDFDKTLESIKEPITQKGDLIILGNHRIMCGDASNPDDLKKLLGDEKPGLLHTDPPYNVNYYGGNRPTKDARPKAVREWSRIYSDNQTQDQYEEWLKGILSNTLSHLGENASIYIWNGHRQFGPMHNILTALSVRVACVITWAKPSFAISYADYNQQTEFCLYGWKKSGKHRWHGPQNESTLWEINRDATKDYIHPTQKPVAIAQRAMRNSSERGEGVLDLFLGSGSTLIAAQSLERRCYGLEIDPRYIDAIVMRYASYVGQDNLPEAVKQRYLNRQ